MLSLQVALNSHTVAMANGHLNGRKIVEISFRQKINMEKNVGMEMKKKLFRFGLRLLEYNIFESVTILFVSVYIFLRDGEKSAVKINKRQLCIMSKRPQTLMPCT